MNKERIEYGDWQTKYSLAKKICELLKKNNINPKIIVEPTCGCGNFIRAALNTFENIEEIYAIDIYKPYLDAIYEIEKKYNNVRFHVLHKSIFDFDFNTIPNNRDVLFLGNPPWITNSALGEIGSENLPQKSNFKKHIGFDAITGKSNFDIAEYILLMIIRSFSEKNGKIAMLVKNSVIKNIIEYQQHNRFNISNIAQYEFNALKEFGAATSASLFLATFNKGIEDQCKSVDLYSEKTNRIFGLIENKLVYDVENYNHFKYIDNRSDLIWRSGLKHDCSKIMEFKKDENKYLNKLGEICEFEENFIYPLLKSSDLKNDIITSTKKFVLVTQKQTSDDTSLIQTEAPKTYKYLKKHAGILDGRKSSIYKNRPRFCIFGIGEYSFKPYKVAISSLYKKTIFSLIEPSNNKPIMLDDTCYLLGFDNRDFAEITQRILNSDEVQGFIHSVSFPDSKRSINKDLLMRIDLYIAAIKIGSNQLKITDNLFEDYLAFLKTSSVKNIGKQSSLEI